ncbi:MAG: hypothetical protein HKN24_05565 [Acidimicrobiales bacterium]|nr:hypothetical protein [Acidimicrobiales bacterium]
MIQRHLDGLASEEDVDTLRANRSHWINGLIRMLDDVEFAIEDTKRFVPRPTKFLVLDDLASEADRIDAVLTDLAGPPRRGGRKAAPAPGEAIATLQLSWLPGRVVAWLGGWNADPSEAERIPEMLAAAGSVLEWTEHDDIKLPDGSTVPAVQAPLDQSLGWLVSLADTKDDETIGVSATWFGLVAATAVRTVTQGRIVPALARAQRGSIPDKPPQNHSHYEVTWKPALVPPETIRLLAESCPGAAAAFETKRDRRAFTDAVLADLTDTIVATSAKSLEVPAPPPSLSNRSDMIEAVLARLDGEPFSAPTRLGSDLARRLDQWSSPVTQATKHPLVVELNEPDASGAWHLRVLAHGDKKSLDPVEQVMVTSSNVRSKRIRDHLLRLERLYDVLLRPGSRRRGEVLLSQDEAWTFMTKVGEVLLANGYDVRVPSLSRKKATASLRLTAEETKDSVVGAQQLANVRWSAVFDGVELSAAEIAELAREARPLVQAQGQWVELDKADLAQAAKALAEREEQKTLTGADMLRQALGLEGSPLPGGVSIAGSGWAVDLLRSAQNLPTDLPTSPDGFVGELRTYQANALAWLGFLESAGLGGCLALDMGLGKTPTMLAHIAQSTDKGPALVIAPPAVVGNWASEARKFVPGVKVLVHHGPNRASGVGIAQAVRKVDAVITTYGTAIRDMARLEDIDWNITVLDEAQAIKNPASETAQTLRRLNGRSKLALTGTPIENGPGDLWAILDWANPGLMGSRNSFIANVSSNKNGSMSSRENVEDVLKALNGLLVFRRTKAEPAIAAELPDRIDELDHCAMTPEQVGLYQATLDTLLQETSDEDSPKKKGAVLAAITKLKQICNHPANFNSEDDGPIAGRSGKLARLEEIIDSVFSNGEKILIFTHFATWGETLANYLTKRSGLPIECYHGGLGRSARDRLVDEFQSSDGAGAMVLSLKAGGTGLNLTAASHVVLYDRWWNPAVEDQARDRVWRIGQKNTVICHRLVCPGTIDERVEEVVAGKRQIADLVLPKSSSVGDLDTEQLQAVLGIDPDALLTVDEVDAAPMEAIA